MTALLLDDLFLDDAAMVAATLPRVDPVAGHIPGPPAVPVPASVQRLVWGTEDHYGTI